MGLIAIHLNRRECFRTEIGNYHLVKPVDLDKLKELLAEARGEQKTSAAARRLRTGFGEFDRLD
jgi:hypothetical protein